MPQSRRPRKRYQADPLVAAARERRKTSEPRPRSTQVIDGEVVRPGGDLVRSARPAPTARRLGGRYLVPVAAVGGGAAVGAGAAHLYNRNRRNKVMKMIDPLSDRTVVLEKRYAADQVEGVLAKAFVWPPQSASFSSAPSDFSGHVSHANKVSHTTHSPRRNPTSKVLVINRSRRSVSGTSVGKSLGQSAGRIGRRLTIV